MKQYPDNRFRVHTKTVLETSSKPAFLEEEEEEEEEEEREEAETKPDLTSPAGTRSRDPSGVKVSLRKKEVSVSS